MSKEICRAMPASEQWKAIQLSGIRNAYQVFSSNSSAKQMGKVIRSKAEALAAGSLSKLEQQVNNHARILSHATVTASAS
jgi:hypothetical protein